jgi:monovalent cation/hydrogen antiporter
MSGINLQVLIGLLVVTIPLVALGRRANISYPIVLVLGGLVLGFIPKLPAVEFDPNLILLLFLPPLLYWQGITAPLDVMRANAGQIVWLAIGLVIATTTAVAVAAHAIIPGLDWGVAFVLGAIVSPTDALAAVPVLERFRLPRRLIAIVEGESLLNDATALVIYATAISVVTTGVFNPGQTLLQFGIAAIGALAIGYIVGRLGVEGWRRITDPQLQGVISVVIPFLAFAPAHHFGLSGVLAVVTAAMYITRFSPRVVVPAARIQIVGFWETLVFLTNAVLFLTVGLQLHSVAQRAFNNHSWQLVLAYSVVVNAVVLAVRLAWVLAAEYIPAATTDAEHAAPAPKNALIEAWSGLRGAVSLAAALAIPVTLSNGSPFPHRDFIIFVTFTVILVTLVGGGLTLPALVRRMKLPEDIGNEERDELREAYIEITEAALRRIVELTTDGRIDGDHALALQRQFEHRRDLHRAVLDGAGGSHAQHHVDVSREIIHAQRQALIALRDEGRIDNAVLRAVQADLDLAESGALMRTSSA